MRKWATLLSGLIVWAAHFFALYIAASVFPGGDTARWLTFVATLAALTANGAILFRTLRRTSDAFELWVRQLGAIGAALSALAVLWQGLPGIIV